MMENGNIANAAAEEIVQALLACDERRCQHSGESWAEPEHDVVGPEKIGSQPLLDCPQNQERQSAH